MTKFDEKAEGRIFVENASDIEKVKSIICEMDEDEYRYLPKDLITTLPKTGFSFTTVYNGKFYEINLDELKKKCNAAGVPIWFLVAHNRVCEYGEYHSVVPEFQKHKFIWQLYLDRQRTKEEMNHYYEIED